MRHKHSLGAITVTPRLMMQAVPLIIFVLPIFFYQYDLSFAFILLANWVAAALAIHLNFRSANIRAAGPTERSFFLPAKGFRHILLSILIIWVAYKVAYDFIFANAFANNMKAAVLGESQSSGTAWSIIKSAIFIILLSMFIKKNDFYLSLVLVTALVIPQVLYGAHRSPVIFLVLATLLVFKTRFHIVTGAVICVAIVSGLTVLNYTRQGVEIASIIDINALVRGLFTVNNFYDLWKADITLDAVELWERYKWMVLPRWVFPEKGIVAMSWILTPLVYDYDPAVRGGGIITFSLAAESYLLAGWLGPLVTFAAVSFYVRYLSLCYKFSPFLFYYRVLAMIMLMRSSIYSMIFSGLVGIIVLTIFLLMFYLSRQLLRRHLGHSSVRML